MRFEYLTFLRYSPRGTSEKAKQSRLYLGKCKNGALEFNQNLVKAIKSANISDYFDGATLVPVPRSTLTLPESFLPTEVIANVLVDNRIGNSVSLCLNRIKPIPKSSGQYNAGERNSVQTHLDSLDVTSLIIPEDKIIIVDDVLTLGRTAMAAAIKLKKAYPDKEIKIFSPFRTRGFHDDNVLTDIKKGYMELSPFGKVILPD
ncbi:phosphoribosyltransferase [Elizabethkingia anophelis]|uniref:phosphoribosyltransferase n=1 Tax=Elizabethkingia anophelis TaxID=1117645 RepID=UPI0021A96863|nr:phosphoribosyltransferase [Elizabethkingia anophelis]